MRILLSWLEEFVDLSGISIEELSYKIRQGTAEVEEVYELFAPLQTVVSARIKSAVPIQGSDHLKLCEVETGKNTYTVVCGAPNAKEGLIAPYAPIGTCLANGITIEKRSIMHTESHGMLLSQKEMDIGEDHTGLLALDAHTPIGQPIMQILGIQKETVLEIDNNSITNRPDLWGMYGFARECAALFDRQLKDMGSDAWKKVILAHFNNTKNPISLDVQAKGCLVYGGFCVEGVSAQEQSPPKIAVRLHAAGMRSVNMLVDISNYVMLETGMPNHFFDLSCITQGMMKIEEASGAQEFLTLDQEKRLLAAGDILVCDKEKPLVIAGIMGGENSAINAQTQKIFVEGALWDSAQIRKTAARLGLRTDASIRYEKSLDSQWVEVMLLRCAQLIKEYIPSAQLLGNITFGKTTDFQPYTLTLDIERVQKLLSMPVTAQQSEKILRTLGFTVSTSGTTLTVSPPSYRSSKEAMVDADVIEEIGRIAGYDTIQSRAPQWQLLPKEWPAHVLLKRRAQDFLVFTARAIEVMTHPLVGAKLLESVGWPTLNEELVLVQALSPERDRFRPSLVPSFIEALDLNQKYYESFSFFEYGKVAYSLKEEHYHTGYLSHAHTSSPFIEVVDMLEGLLGHLSIPYTLSSKAEIENPLLPSSWTGVHPYEYLHIYSDGMPIGFVASLHPGILKKRKIKGYTSLFVVDLTPWSLALKEKILTISPPIRYQESVLDFTVLAAKSTAVGDILCVLPYPDEKHHIISVKVRDIFEQQDDFKAVTLRIRLNHHARTLTAEDIKHTSDYIVQTLETHHWPLKK